MNQDAAPQDGLAARVVARMMERDAASRHLGMEVLETAPGLAEVRMAVRPEMLNGHGSCHGGFIFALADSAFAFACNSRNEVTVAAGCQIDYLRPAREGEQLTARAEERALPGRTGVYDVAVRNQEGALVALFRGRSYRVQGQIVDA